jgi:hypothetical protein
LLPAQAASRRKARGQVRRQSGKDVDYGLKSDKPGATTSGSAAADERRLVRQQKSRALVNAIEPWLRAKLRLISQKSKLALPIRYALSRWRLTLFIDDGRIEPDDDIVERSEVDT